MSNIIFAISNVLGIAMKWCFAFVKDYGLAIILFTLLTKVILFPISIVTQKNSIKMAKLRPKLDDLKIKYVDDKDKYADAQLELYKKEKYHPLLDLIPLFVQIIIVLGLVGVMYRPLSYILELNDSVIEQLRNWLTNDLSMKNLDSSYQLEIIRQIQSGKGASVGIEESVLNHIFDFNMNFCGLNLSARPSFHENYELLLIPLFSGFSAWMMCVVQNKINILQLYAGKINKYGTTIFMIAFSVYFSMLVPAGVGIYWIFGNLFAIPSMYLLNKVVPPEKYIDVKYIKEMQKVQQEKEKYLAGYSKLEKSCYKRFFEVKDMKLMFYSEQKGFYKYYEPIIDYICEKSDYVIHYVTSDAEDPILKNDNEQVQAYYIARDKYLIPLFMKLDCDMCVMTMPDIEKYHIKRSRVRKDIEYVYVPHGMGSTALTFRKGALDHYDTIFCVGIDAVNEIRETEHLYGTKKKLIVETGYVLLDNMIAQYEENGHEEKGNPYILIAPSWQPDNIIDTCIETILDKLADSTFDVILRPHPQQLRHEAERFKILKDKYKDCHNIFIETDFSSNTTVMDADVLITDWSDISFEYAFTTLKPVLFVDTPMKIMNNEYDRIDTVPINISLRKVLGKSVKPEAVEAVKDVVNELVANRELYRNKILQAREEHIFNVGKSKILSGKYIVKSLDNTRR